MRVQADERLAEVLRGTMLEVYLIGSSNGLRISDVLSLKVRHVRAYRPTIRERKTGKSKRLYIPTRLRASLLARCEGQPAEAWLFPSPSDSSKPLTRQAVYKAFKKAERRLDGSKRVGTHSMRKAYAQKLLRKGKSLHAVRLKLNHKYLSDTLRYATDKSIEELVK